MEMKEQMAPLDDRRLNVAFQSHKPAGLIYRPSTLFCLKFTQPLSLKRLLPRLRGDGTDYNIGHIQRLTIVGIEGELAGDRSMT